MIVFGELNTKILLECGMMDSDRLSWLAEAVGAFQIDSADGESAHMTVVVVVVSDGIVVADMVFSAKVWTDVDDGIAAAGCNELVAVEVLEEIAVGDAVDETPMGLPFYQLDPLSILMSHHQHIHNHHMHQTDLNYFEPVFQR